MAKSAVGAITVDALLEKVRDFDRTKFAAGGYDQLAMDLGKGEEYFASLETGVENLCVAFAELDVITSQPVAGDVSRLEKAFFAATKRLQNWRNSGGSWKGAQFGIELQNYARAAGLDGDASSADEETLESVLKGYEALRSRCARAESKWTFSAVFDAIEAKLAEIQSLPED